MNLSPVFVAVFAFCFAVTLGVFWEIYEFTFDGILRLNMQKFMLENGTQLIGRAALLDTMKDLIVDCLGALIMSFVGYLKERRISHRKRLYRFLVCGTFGRACGSCLFLTRCARHSAPQEPAASESKMTA